MGYAINLKTIGEIIEDFLVKEFDELDIAGSVSTAEDDKINYIKIDLEFFKNWDQDAEKLSISINTYLSSLFKAKPLDLYYMVKFKNLTLDIKAPNRDNSLSKNIHLFYIEQRFLEEIEVEHKFKIFFRENWQTLTSITLTLTLAIMTLLLFKEEEEQEKFSNAVAQVNIFAGIIGAFVLSYILTKALAIRQEKLMRVNSIRDNSYKLTCFRKICYQVRKDHRFWNNSASYNYAQRIAKQIDYTDARFPDYDNDVRYASYKALINNHQYDASILMFYLQLYMFAGEEFEYNASLAWGNYPPFKIYSNTEIEKYLPFLDIDEFWTCIEDNKKKFSYSHNDFHIKPIEIAAKNYNLKGFENAKFSEELLLNIATDVQSKIIPELFHLTKLNEARLPFTIKYSMWMTAALMFFSVIYPLIAAIFWDKNFTSNLNVFVILGLVIDIILRLPLLLQQENTMNLPDDYR